MTPSMVMIPPCHKTSASAIELIMVTVDEKKAEYLVVRTDVLCILEVSLRKSFPIVSSMTSVLIDLAPVMPSLKLDVILELISLISRLSGTRCFWK